MSDLSEELTVILTIIWWLQKLERETVSMQMSSTEVCMGWFNLKKLNDVEVKEEY